MRRSTEHNQLTRPVRCNLFQQLVALLLVLRPLVSGIGSRVNLIDDHQIWAMFKKLWFPTITLGKVNTDYDVSIVLVWADTSPRNHPLQTCDSARTHDLRMDMKLVAQFSLPLIAQMRRTQDAKPSRVAASE